MHIRAITKARPAQAQNLFVVLDLINQVIGALLGLERLLGIDFSELIANPFQEIFKGD